LKARRAALAIAASTRYGKTRGNAIGQSMGEYRLSKSAEDDLIAIAQYGDEHFGKDLYSLPTVAIEFMTHAIFF